MSKSGTLTQKLSFLVQIVGFTVGLIPAIRKSMIGDAAPLRVIEDSTLLLG